MTHTATDPQAFAPEQVNLLFRACRMTDSMELLARDHALVALLIDTGLSLSEVVTLRHDRLRVMAGPEEKAYVVVSPKGRDQYRAFLGLHARQALTRYWKEGRTESKTPWLFVDEAGKPFTPQALSRLLARVGARMEDRLGGIPVTIRTFQQTYRVTKRGLGAGESVLDALDAEAKRRLRRYR